MGDLVKLNAGEGRTGNVVESPSMAERLATMISIIGEAALPFSADGNNIISAAFGVLTQEVQRENMNAAAAHAESMSQGGNFPPQMGT